ncbi:2-(1,2-epoxy-1,2-dihydrophenyl)acetyl-CoA isomerase [Jatrophihabitans sp. GAS493]|uniref:enoyl-CoA hydratase/isomerase family protein n=1 Tax=Jatrophihabitans sp. GAS493 TaxID=1907575 RepID=UPI000BB8BE42|nr:enoyl-CoA hydratase-related protein [Jatrophihabitans sp. GAS493]SOD72802.1 2-(1,2-epoxy-1,2-dihydrophenyl)acetyl-CoA isomerase [Jatrophihabitans sp. GAS493]
MVDQTSKSQAVRQAGDHIARVVLPRASLDTAGKSWLLERLTTVGADPNIRVVVLTGEGRAFCVGQDLKEHAAALAGDPRTTFDTLAAHYEPIVSAITSMPKPVLAAINGTCVGAGLSFALACDLRIARAGAVFATAFTGIGLSFDSGLSATLARAVGYARASELIIRGDSFTAEQALAWGLVGEVVAAEEWDTAVDALATRLAHGPTQAYAAAKAALASGWGAPLPEVLHRERTDQIRLGSTEDHRGAVESFLAKQRPTFTGR